MDIKRRFETTKAEDRDLISVDTKGYLQGISLTSFLQLVEQDKKTCTVEVSDGTDHGRLHFRKGQLINAETAELSGLKAAQEIVKWEEPAIEIKVPEGIVDQKIEKGLMEILLDTRRIQDESERREPPEAAETVENTQDQTPVVDEGTIFHTNRTHVSDGSPGASVEPQGAPMNSLQAALEAFREEVPEFVSTDIVNIDSGLSIGGGSIDPDFDASVASASYAEVVKANSRALELLGLGADSTEDLLISTEKLYLLIRLLGKEYYQVLAVTRRGNLGLARAIMKKHAPKLLAAVDDLS